MQKLTRTCETDGWQYWRRLLVSECSLYMLNTVASHLHCLRAEVQMQETAFTLARVLTMNNLYHSRLIN